MTDCPRPIKSCSATVITEKSAASCEPWECCLPWGASLKFDGSCLRYTPGTPPEDGTYGSVVVVDGCVAGVGELESEIYRGEPCAPVPCPCSEDGDGGGSTVCSPSSTSGNLYSCDATGKPLVKCYVNGGDNVSVTGSGTSTNPFVITVDTDSGLTTLSTNTGSVIKVSKNGEIGYVDHQEVYGESSIINGMSFDKYGHLSGYSEVSSSGVNGVVGTNGITATTDNSSKIVTIELADPANALAGDYTVGGYTLTLDSKNRVYNLVRGISLTENKIHVGTRNVQYNEYGSITEVEDTNILGSFIHTLLDVPAEETTRRSITFSLYYATHMVIDVECMNAASWADGLTMRVDGSTVGDVFTVVGQESSASPDSGSGGGTESTPSPVYIRKRFVPNGVYTVGQHTILLIHPDGYSTEYPMSVSVIPTQNVDSVEDS